MAETICRALRDGALEGEHAPALTIKDSFQTSFGIHAFNHVLHYLASNILGGKSQARGLVLVALNRSPSFYLDFLKSRGIHVSNLDNIGIRVLDCYTDPLGWKEKIGVLSGKESESLCKDVRDVNKIFDAVLQLGRGMVGQGKVRFCVAIDSVTVMLRHASLSSVAGLISNLRSHDQVSSIFWLIHSDLHGVRASAVLEYMSSMVASLEPMLESPNKQEKNSENLNSISGEGKFHVRLKRRNGRVRIMYEEFHVEETGIRFLTISSGTGNGNGNGTVNQNILPKLQFNLRLSEKERTDRENVVLPFEHQGNGQSIQIYDGRRSLPLTTQNDLTTSIPTKEKSHTEIDQGKGEIHYFRDSDDELPDSDEDPDDDLDI